MTGPALTTWRTGRGWSMRRLAIVLGVHTSTVMRWERGDQPVPLWLPYALRGLELG